MIAELRFDVSSDLLEFPDYIKDKLEAYQEQFWKWLFDKNIEHKYWCFKNGLKEYVSYRGDAFVEWLNLYPLSDKPLKAKISETHINKKINCDIVLYF